jgi:pimeloyl-ACP methyl ester carboxylesterase
LHWAHATGFHARTYTPLLDRLSGNWNVVAWDMRGHGASHAAALAQKLHHWDTYYRDLTQWLDEQNEPVWLAGHSIGATISLVAAARRPGQVAGLLLAEPVLLAGWPRWLVKFARLAGATARLPHPAAARARRSHFPSKSQAMNVYRGRGAFATWPDEWLAAYVAHGLIAEGNNFRLACSPAWEADTFASVDPDSITDIKALQCPLLVLQGTRQSTVFDRARAGLERRAPAARFEAVANTTHFLPMEQPEAIVRGLSGLFAEAS